MDEKIEKEKIVLQYIMNYKAYRRKTIALRIGVAVVIAGGCCGLCALSLVLGIVTAAMALILGTISVLVSLGYEESYTLYNTRVVIKRKNKEKRLSVALDGVTAVGYRRAFYERDVATGTVTFVAKNDKGRRKKYKLKHIFDANPAVEYFKRAIDKNNGGQSGEGRE